MHGGPARGRVFLPLAERRCHRNFSRSFPRCFSSGVSCWLMPLLTTAGVLAGPVSCSPLRLGLCGRRRSRLLCDAARGGAGTGQGGASTLEPQRDGTRLLPLIDGALLCAHHLHGSQRSRCLATFLFLGGRGGRLLRGALFFPLHIVFFFERIPTPYPPLPQFSSPHTPLNTLPPMPLTPCVPAPGPQRKPLLSFPVRRRHA